MKTETKQTHTPGPWQVDDHRFVTASKDRAFATIAEVQLCESELDDETFYEISEKEAVANARLIATAPELLDLLKTIIRKVDAGLVGSPNWYVWDKARAAIAKAEGTE